MNMTFYIFTFLPFVARLTNRQTFFCRLDAHIYGEYLCTTILKILWQKKHLKTTEKGRYCIGKPCYGHSLQVDFEIGDNNAMV